MKPWLEALWRLVYPEQCLVCGRVPGADRRHFCAECYQALPWVGEPSCPRCGAAAGLHASTAQGCAACRSHRFAFRRAVAPLRYQGVARELILAFKLGRRASLAYVLGDLLCNYLGEGGLSQVVDLVVPVPLHWRRRVRRGFNQAGLLALEASTRFRLPLAAGLLKRRRATMTQTALSGLRRGANVRDAFAVRAARNGRLLDRLAGRTAVLGKRVLLVDDVFTTGSTVNECARVLRAAGAAEVLVATVAHTCR
ncbi:MAG TPA: double zinc ribbon domain-containing protein [Planctomycetota bacterium]|nr:double zinc ribbon domain-containing protein [Planctomycetota bacterium]